MQKISFILAVVICLTAGIASANMLANGDFESGKLKGAFSSGYPDGWEEGWGGNGWHHNDASYKYDNWGVAIWGNDTSLVQDIPAREGESFIVSGDMIYPSAEALTNKKGIIKIEFWDGPLQSDTKLSETQIGILTDANTADTWYHFSSTVIPLAGTAEARIVILVENTPGPSSGKAYFDNINVIQLNPPATSPDFNNDQEINLSDYAKLAGDWMQQFSLYDLDGDEDIDNNDLKFFVESWLIPVPAYSGYELVWSDEFYGSRINYENWTHQIGDGTAYGLPSGWGNNELEYYTARPENSYVRNGNLVIVARNEFYRGYNYTSTRLRSFAKVNTLYGKIEARIKLPTGKGIWPAYWMLPTDWVYGGWAASGEIDIMESINIPTTIHGTIHYGGKWPANTYSGGLYSDGNDFSEDFHIYTLEWEPLQMRWYVDGILYSTKTSWWSSGGSYPAPFDQRFHLILNIAVGGNWPGNPDESTVFPQQMIVDWIRIYQKP